DESGSITSFVSTGKDVTERLQAERAQRVLYKVSQEAGYAPDLESLFRSVHSIIGEVMPARNFYIALHSKGEDTISFPYFIDERDEPTPPQKFGKGLTEYVLRTGASLLCDSMKHRELMETGEAELVGEASPIWLGVPLTIDKRTVGVMALQDYENERAYGKKEVEILEFVSGQVVRAIQRKQAEEMLATAHHQLESLHESLDLAVFSVDTKTDQILQASPAHERVFGYSAERFFENPRLWYEIIIPEDKPIVDAGYPTLMAGKLLRHEFRIRRPNGDVTWVEAQMKPTLDREGALMRIDGIATDITEKKLAEQDLANELNFNKTIIDQSPVGIIAYNAAGAAISANEAVARITGGTREQLLSQNYHHIESWKPSGLLAKALEARDTGKESECEASVQTTFGKEVWLSCRFVPFEYHGEKHLLVHFIDNTAEKHAQDHLEQSEKELRALFGAMTDVVLVLDEQGRNVRIAPTNPVNLYVPPKDLLGRHVGDVLPKTDADLVMGKIKECLESGKQVIYEYHLEIGGRMIWYEGRVSPLSETSVFFIARDITDRKHAEAKTEEQAKLLELASDAIVVRGLDDVVHFWNSGAEKLYGWPKEEAVGKKIKDLIYSTIEEFDQAQAVVLGEGSWFGELRQRTKAGKEIVANSRWTLVRDASGKPKSILVINSDITMKKQLEVHALRAQRLESIGTLAGGIAHDLNNALGPILLGIQVIANHVTDSRARQLLESMEGSAKRGAEMVKQILAFAKGFSGEFGILGLKHVIREAQNIIRETFPKNIDLDVQISGNLWNIMGDSTQLHQLLINLCVNARDAMASGGRLTISAENFTVDETYAQMHSGLKAGPHVLLKVVDTGTGMPKDVMEKIFDPFFTTKDSGKGTGLGLSTVATIVKGHTGAVGVYSEPRRGTTFRILLPALPGAESRAHVDQSEMPRGNGEMLLVVDDEITLREMTKQTLEMFGYTVLTAADGTEAVTQFIGHKGQVAAVITDMAMPVMDGEATIRALRRIDPNVRIIATSGQHNTISENVVKRLEIERSLLKPFTAEQLLRTLSVVLGNKEGG
ncbi:MAG: PAS domain S-box protein, partial [Bacteroidota bacterium]